MLGLKHLLNQELERLKLIDCEARKRLRNAPEGNLRISLSNNCVQYYRSVNVKENENLDGYEIRREYLKSNPENFELVKRLAQKSYDNKILKLTQRRIRQIEGIIKDYEDNEVENIYENCSNWRKRLIDPVEPVRKNLEENWNKEPYQGKEFREGTPYIYTEKGERVRSKSEKILADYFYHKGINYKYEKPLNLKGFGTVYPDFTFFSPKTGKEIYWEHEGRMDDPSYARSAIKKIEDYERNGIFIGRNLILTFETETTVLNTKDIERKVERYLCI